MKVVKSVGIDEEILERLHKIVENKPFVKLNLSALVNSLLSQWVEDNE